MKAKLQTVLSEEIPITQAIGVKVENISLNSVELSAPLENNINHKSTAFGGSLYSIAVLAGWSLLYTQLANNNINAHIVIQESNIKYLLPVASDIHACCQISDQQEIEKLIKVFKRKGIARLNLVTEILQHNKLAVLFEGKYVIHS